MIRRQDWELKVQDGNPNLVGEVMEVVSCNGEDIKDSVRVSWERGGQTNNYRVSKNVNVFFSCFLVCFVLFLFFLFFPFFNL